MIASIKSRISSNIGHVRSKTMSLGQVLERRPMYAIDATFQSNTYKS